MHLEDAYGDKVRVAYRHLPLISIHDKAVITAEASEAAGAQGQFFEMHDLLYERQGDWVGLSGEDEVIIPKMVEYAAELGLDTERFQQELNDHIYRDKILADYEAYGQFGRLATPTYAVNNVFVSANEVSMVIDLTLMQDRMYTDTPPQIIDPKKDYTATIHTERGDIVIELYADKAPVTVNSFVFLAQSGWYDDVAFHRVIPGFVAQSGDPTGSGGGYPGYRCSDEIYPTLKFDKAGVVGMASSGPGTDTVGSQFFITYDAIPDLDDNYTIIGQVIEGMDVAESLTPRDPGQGMALPPGDVIQTITIEEK
ncbi:MAG: peptidylprolyl isomerase [Anaerolineae bacterium]|nr:peptidylprolyl isomerase [Anaerolineae bacterium]